jgi:hypothetical protein
MDLTKIDKPFGDLDDATKGALLLADHRGEVIEVSDDGLTFMDCDSPIWIDDLIYRVQPKPVIGEVVMMSGGAVYHSLHPVVTGHDYDYKLRVTFPTRDGLHVPGVYTSQDGLQIKIEVAK